MQGRDFAGGMGYRWGFGTQETDNEVSGGGNSYTAEFWQYDCRLGRRWNVDPRPNSSISTYSVFEGNPIRVSDIFGDTIRIPNVDDRLPIIRMINSISLGLFDVDANGNLVLVRVSGDNNKFSQLYQQKLISAINSKQVLEVQLADFVDYNGEITDVQKQFNGGVTFKEVDEDKNKSAIIFITGKNSSILDHEGNTLFQTPAEILMHEFVGHGIPYLVKSETGNAVDNENNVRRELGRPLRLSDPDHHE